MEFLMALAGIMMVNIVLSGDNAVVIAMASRCLPPEQQRKAILWGSAGAIGLRVVLTVVAVVLLSIPYLQFVGGLLLVWIAAKLFATIIPEWLMPTLITALVLGGGIWWKYYRKPVAEKVKQHSE